MISLRDTPFNKQEKQLMSALTPHMRRAYQVQHHAAEAYRHQHFALHALDQFNVGITLIDDYQRVRYFNQYVQSLMDQQQVNIKGERLKLHRHENQQQLDAAIKAAILRSQLNTDILEATESPGEIILASPGEGQAPLILLVLPCRQSTSPGGVLNSAYGAVVFALNQQQERPIRIDYLRQLFQLSEKEGHVLQALVEGSAPKDIAEVMCITKDTVNFHIKNLYNKTDTRGHTGLVNLYEKSFGVLQAEDG